MKPDLYSPRTKLFWVYRDHVYDVSEAGHARFLLENAALFNFRAEKSTGTKGAQAVESLPFQEQRLVAVASALSSGWIKVQRFFEPRTYWTIEADSTDARRDDIGFFIGWATENASMSPDEEVFLIGEEDSIHIQRFSWSNGGIRQFLRSEAAVVY